MSIPVTVYDYRLSFIWVETFLDFLAASAAPPAPLAFLGRSYTYEPYVADLLEGAVDVPEPDLELPWRLNNIESQHFWERFFEGQVPPNARRCWKGLVPLRWKLPLDITADWLPGWLLPEAFFYPHGVGLVFTAYCAGNMSLDEVVTTAHAIRKGGRYNLRQADGRRFRVSLDQLAALGLRMARARAYGFDEDVRPKAAQPFSIFTVVQGSELDPREPVEQGGAIQRMLEAVTRWSNTYAYDPLPDLERVTMDPATSRNVRPKGHLVYAHRRARAIWFPAFLGPQEENVHYLACYHRNLTLLSLTVESLVGLVAATNQRLQEGVSLSAAHRDVAYRAVDILGRLYGGATTTYRSWSPRRHLDQNRFVPVVNTLRRYFGKQALQ